MISRNNKILLAELPLDFKDYKDKAGLLSRPESLTYSIKHLYDDPRVQTIRNRPVQAGAPDNAIS